MRVRRMSVLLAGVVALVMVAGCAPRYAYYDHHDHGRVKGYYLADGTYVKTNPGRGHDHYYVEKKVVVVKKKKKGK